MHSNFSTEATRSEGGFDLIISMMDKLSSKHTDHIAVYGKNNHERLTGLHETSSMDKFSYKVASRGVSVRVPN